MHYLSSENKGAGQLCGYCTADLRLCFCIGKRLVFSQHVSYVPALDNLGFGGYKEDATAVLQEAKAVAAKKRRGSSKLENLGIPEEELVRQQQELFAQVSKREKMMILDFRKDMWANSANLSQTAARGAV